jgi:hypothetical protein
MTGIAKRALRIVPPQCGCGWIVLTAIDNLTTSSYPM